MQIQHGNWRLIFTLVLMIGVALTATGSMPRIVYKTFFPVPPSQWLIQGKMIYVDDDEAAVDLKTRAFSPFFLHRCKHFPLNISLGSDTWKTKTDDGGNFYLVATTTFSESSASGPFEFVFTSDSRVGWKEAYRFEGTASPTFLVISDVDDTVLVTQVTNRFKMLMKTFFIDPEKRGVVVGTPQIYQALVRGVDPNRPGHLVFVSASPMYLAPRLEAFFATQQFPAYTLILREFGFKEKWEDKDEELTDYKMTKISDLLARTASMPAILLGDSGERDPEIYGKVVEAFPGRVLCVVIRNVTEQDELDSRYADLKKKVRLIVWRDPQKLLSTLLDMGLIVASQ